MAVSCGTGGAYRTGPDADFHAVGSRIGERTRCSPCGDVARHDVQRGVCGLDGPQCPGDVYAVAVSGIEYHGVHILGVKRRYPVEYVGGDTHPGGYPQAPLVVLAGIGVILHLGDVAVGYESNEFSGMVYHRQFLYLVPEQDFGGVLEVGVVGGDEPLLRHDLLYLPRSVFLETEVAVGDDAYQRPVGRDDGDAAYAVLLHEAQRVAYGILLENGDRVVNHAVFGTFHLPHLRCLLLDRHVFVYHSDTSLPCERDGQRGFGDRIHCGGYDGNVKTNVS